MTPAFRFGGSMLFDDVLPVTTASRPDDKDKPKRPEEERDDPRQRRKRDDVVRTQMVGEKPGDDLGYDPAKIPVEPIPD